MNKEDRIEQEIAKTLACLDNIENIEAGPYLYSRLRARLETPVEPREQWYRQLLSKQMLRPAFLIVLVVVNLITAVLVLQNNRGRIDHRRVHLSAVAEEYSLHSTKENDYLSGVLE